MASLPAVVVAGQNSHAAHRDRAAYLLLYLVAQYFFTAGHLHRRQEDAVRELRQPFGLTTETDEFLNRFVVRDQVFV